MNRAMMSSGMHYPEAIVETIRADGDLCPVVGVHGLGAGQKFYRPLSERLAPDHPVYGVWTPPRQSSDSAASDVFRIASSYADALTRIIPTGPVALGAVSSASVIAFEVAHQLFDRRREVALLVLFDALGPDVDKIASSSRHQATIHLRELQDDPLSYVEGRLRSARAHVRRGVGIGNLKAHRTLGRPLTGDLLRRSVVEDTLALQRAYRHRPYRGRVLVFKGGNDAFRVDLAARGLGWAEIVEPAHLDVAVVPGGHLSLLAEPNVEHVASKIRCSLADVALEGE